MEVSNDVKAHPIRKGSRLMEASKKLGLTLAAVVALLGCAERAAPVDVGKDPSGATTPTDDRSEDASITNKTQPTTPAAESISRSPGPPASIVPDTPGPPWPATGVELISPDASQRLRLTPKDGQALRVAVEEYLHTPAAVKASDSRFAERLAGWKVGEPMADGPRIGRFLLTLGNYGELELTTSLEIRAHHRYDFTLIMAKSANAYRVRRAFGRLSDGGSSKPLDVSWQ